jgi:hypothetical protein
MMKEASKVRGGYCKERMKFARSFDRATQNFSEKERVFENKKST